MLVFYAFAQNKHFFAPKICTVQKKARTLKAVFDAATSEAGAAAVAYCLEHEKGLDREHFLHEGLTFSLDYKCDYKYADNDTDSHDKPAGYKEAKRTLEAAKKTVDVWKAKLKAAEKVIVLAHPNMAPVNPTWTMKYYCKEV